MSLDIATDRSHDGNEKLVQFEDCIKEANGEKSDCKFKDINGKCIFETCIVENELPPTQILWYYECIACKNVDCINPNEMKIHLCHQCIERLQRSEVLPFTCIICGQSQATPAQGWSTPICDTCLRKLNNSVHCKHCGN